MSKVLKKFLIILIALIGTLVIMPKEEKAFELNENTTINTGAEGGNTVYPNPTVKDVIEKKQSIPGWGGFVLHNNYVYCIEKNQEISPTFLWRFMTKEIDVKEKEIVVKTYSYEKKLNDDNKDANGYYLIDRLYTESTETYEESADINAINGILHIINSSDEGYGNADSDTQLAMWAYLYSLSKSEKTNNISTILDNCNLSNNEPNEKKTYDYKIYKIGDRDVIYKREGNNKYVEASNATKLFQEAVSGNNTYTGKIYILGCADGDGKLIADQKVMLGETKGIITPTLKFQIQKTSKDATDLSLKDAKFHITMENVAFVNRKLYNTNGYTLTTKDEGKTKVLNNIIAADITQNIKITVEETSAPPGFNKAPKHDYYFRYLDGEWKCTNASQDRKDEVTLTKDKATVSTATLTIIEPLSPSLDFNIIKVNKDNEPISGAIFNINVKNVEKIENATYDYDNKTSTATMQLTSNSEGRIDVGNIIPKVWGNSSEYVTIEITEIEAPDGYDLVANGTAQKYYLYYSKTDEEWKRWDSKTKKWISNNIKDKRVYEVTMEEPDSKPLKYSIKKVDSITKEALNGAKFNIQISNVSTYKTGKITKNGKNGNAIETLTSKTIDGEDGLIKITDITPVNWKEPVTITIKEIKAPDGHYIKNKSETTYEFTYDKAKHKWIYIASGRQYEKTSFEFTKENPPFAPLDFNVEKLDKITKLPVYGAEFKVTVTNVDKVENIQEGAVCAIAKNTATITGLISTKATKEITENGQKVTKEIALVDIGNITPKDWNTGIKITVEETTVPEGYQKGKNKIYYFKYDTENGNWQRYEDEKFTDPINNAFKSTFTSKYENIPAPLDFDIIKVDKDNHKPLPDAEFEVTVTNVNKIENLPEGATYNPATKTITGLKSNDNGIVDLGKITPNNWKNAQKNGIEVTIKETHAPAGYKKIDPVTYTFKLGKDKNGKYIWNMYDENDNIVDSGLTLTQTIEDDKTKLEIDLSKYTSEDGSELNGTVFDFEFENATVDGSNTKTEYKPNTDKPFDVELTEDTKLIKIKITEKTSVDGYQDNVNKIYNYTIQKSQAGIWEITDRSIDTKTHAELNEFVNDTSYIKDKKLIVKAYNDSDNDEIRDYGNVVITGTVWEEIQQGDKAAIGAGNGVIDDNEKDKVMDGVDVEFTGTVMTYEPTYQYRYYTKIATGEKDDSGEDIYNVAFKVVGTDNGIEFDDNGTIYHIYRKEITGLTTNVTTYDANNPLTATTEAGVYNFKISLPTYTYIVNGKTETKESELKDGKITFKYNGVEYQSTIANVQGDQDKISHAEDEGRDAFNNKFKNVDLSNKLAAEAYGGFKTTLGLLGESKVEIENNGKGKNNGSFEYQMNAINNLPTITSNGNTQTIIRNLGLVKRGIDVYASSNIESAEIKINGTSATYDYSEIISGNLSNVDLDELIQDDKPVPIEIYPVDYNYRVDPNSAYAKNLGKTKDDEIKVFVTYKVHLGSHTAGENTSINQIAYYYDSNYDLIEIKDSNGTILKENNSWSDKLSKIEGLTGIMVDLGDKCKVASDDKNEKLGDNALYFKFELKKNNEKLPIGEIDKHIVTITSYTTENGLLDINSAIRNIKDDGKNADAMIQEYKDIQFENDTSASLKAEIKLSTTTRKISGNVFEDLETTEETKNIKDVIVQLIEIGETNYNGQTYINEYCWQQTTSGENGEYKFEGIVPAYYIVRFIYGDVYTYGITPNNTTYNGIDYRSTKDAEYDKEWYNTTDYFNTGVSVARDNEAKRLEVMAFTTNIDAGLGTALDVYAKNKDLSQLTKVDKENIAKYLNIDVKDLNDNSLTELKKDISQKTCMSAETSKIRVPLDAKEQKELKQISSNPSIKVTKNTSGYTLDRINIDFTKVNFGLMKKPQVKLELEKHVTALKVTPKGEGVQSIIDARADIKHISYDSLSVIATGMTTGFSGMPATRINRGYWWEATDEELVQGANLEVEYTYKVTNNGEPDYLSDKLVNAYSNNAFDDIGNYKKADHTDVKTYKKYLEEVAKVAKSDIYAQSNKYGTYLGKDYYTMEKKANVTARAESIEESLNPMLTVLDKGSFEITNINPETNTVEPVKKQVLNVEGIAKDQTISQVVTSGATKVLLTEGNEEDKTDATKTIKLTRVLDALNTAKEGDIASYIAEITGYSSATGGRNREAIPGNLAYVHSEDTDVNMDNTWLYNIEDESKNIITCAVQDNQVVQNEDGSITIQKTIQNEDGTTTKQNVEGAIAIRKANETDEFWAESIKLSKPTGEDRSIETQVLPIIIVIISSTVLVAGIVVIKKFVIKK